MKTLDWACTLSILFFSALSLGQAHPLQLQDVVRLGIERSPIIKKDEADLASLREQTGEYEAQALPNIYADVSDTYQQFPTFGLSNPNPGSNSNNNAIAILFGQELYKGYVGVSQPLYVGGLISSGIDLRRQMEQAQTLQNESDKQNLVLNLVTAFYNYAQQTHLLHAATKNVKLLTDYDNIIKKYRRIGRARRIDEMQADVNLLSAQADENNAESQRKQMLEQLRQLLALEEPPEIAVPEQLVETKVDRLNTMDAVDKALHDNPDLLVLQKQRDEVANQEAVDFSQDLPSLYLTGQYGYETGNAALWFGPNYSYEQAMLELKIPLFSGLSSIYKRRSYAQQTESATRNLENDKLQIEASLRQQLTELQASYARLKVARQADILARRALRRGMREFQRGLASTQDMLDLQTTRYSAEKLFISTYFDYLITYGNAQKLMGTDLEGIYTQPQ